MSRKEIEVLTTKARRSLQSARDILDDGVKPMSRAAGGAVSGRFASRFGTAGSMGGSAGD